MGATLCVLWGKGNLHTSHSGHETHPASSLDPPPPRRASPEILEPPSPDLFLGLSTKEKEDFPPVLNSYKELLALSKDHQLITLPDEVCMHTKVHTLNKTELVVKVL